MNIGETLRTLREERKLSQGDIEARTGLLRCYVSRVENGHTVPSLETLEKWAPALGMKLYQLMYSADGRDTPVDPLVETNFHNHLWGSSGKHSRYFGRMLDCLSKIGPEERAALLYTARKLVRARKLTKQIRASSEPVSTT